MRWVWDEKKNRANERDHGIDFDTARLVFEDPLAVTRSDPYPCEERWQTIGCINYATLFVVHTWPERDPLTHEQSGRIISARQASNRERKDYEEDTF